MAKRSKPDAETLAAALRAVTGREPEDVLADIWTSADGRVEYRPPDDDEDDDGDDEDEGDEADDDDDDEDDEDDDDDEAESEPKVKASAKAVRAEARKSASATKTKSNKTKKEPANVGTMSKSEFGKHLFGLGQE